MTKSKARTLLNVKKNYFLRAFLWGFGLAFLIFLPWMIMNGGYFFFYGDYNVQQIPFYQMIHDSIQSGNLGWSYTTDLGANIIGSYSFYMIGSPFFWFTLLFPSDAVPYLVAPLLMVKIGCASLAAYTFLRRYVKNQDYAIIGALLYALSGFSVYNIFFNHFHEAMITFPFMLAAFDSFIYEKRKGVVAVSVFAACFINYYFFAGQAVFLFLYWCVRMATKSFRMTFKEFLRFALEIILGFLASAIILVPSVFAVLQNNRVSNSFVGWGALVYTSEQRYIHILESFFFPPDMPAYANFTPDSNAKWASVAGWLPLFSMVGVFSFYKLKTHKWLRMMIPILFIIAYIPILNSMFQLMNSSYYARWFYMLTMILVLATVLCLDHVETDFQPGLKITFIVTVAIAALIGFLPSSTSEKNGVTVTEYGLEKYPDRFWIWVAIAILSLCALTIVLTFRKKQKTFVRTLSIALSICIVVYGNILIGTGVTRSSYNGHHISTFALGNKDKFTDLKDLKSVRSDFYKEMDNIGMYWQVPTIQAFQSIVPGSVMEFYPSVGVERSVGSRPDTDVYAIRSLLSVKYLFDNDTISYDFENGMGNMKMPGWKYLKTENHFKIYENEYFIPYGFTYDTYVTRSEYNECDEDNRSLLMLKSLVIEDKDVKKYKNILKHDTQLKDYQYSQAEYFNDCKARAMISCSSIDFENSKFTAKITTGNNDELVFFSIPYEDGWSATVNGQSADIVKVNVGFMAVQVPANQTSTIQFTYSTPGLGLGATITGGSVVIFAVYMFLWKTPKKKKKEEELFVIDDLDTETNYDIFENELAQKGAEKTAKSKTFMLKHFKKKDEDTADKTTADVKAEPQSADLKTETDESSSNNNQRTKL